MISKKGFTIVELIISLMIFSIIIMTLAGVTNYFTKMTAKVTNMNRAYSICVVSMKVINDAINSDKTNITIENSHTLKIGEKRIYQDSKELKMEINGNVKLIKSGIDQFNLSLTDDLLTVYIKSSISNTEYDLKTYYNLKGTFS